MPFDAASKFINMRDSQRALMILIPTSTRQLLASFDKDSELKLECCKQSYASLITNDLRLLPHSCNYLNLIVNTIKVCCLMSSFYVTW